jgi:hypothetical protein
MRGPGLLTTASSRFVSTGLIISGIFYSIARVMISAENACAQSFQAEGWV